MGHVTGYSCPGCDRRFGLEESEYVCPACGGNLDVTYDYGLAGELMRRHARRLDADRSMWRYAPLLPVSEESRRPPLQIGWTPLYRVARLGRRLGMEHLYIKDDGRNPSASLKDRASAIVTGRAMERAETMITAASTGNAAASLACLCAAVQIRTVIFVPASAPPAKLAQLLVFGSRVIMVDGDYDDAFELSLAATQLYGWYNRNTGHNPFTREGKKTAAYEICEQLGWHAPDRVFVPVGDGNILSGLWKGFTDLQEIGFIEKMPALVACQAEGSDAVSRAFLSGRPLRPSGGRTVADSIAVRLPRDGEAAVRALRQSRGTAITVSDQAILEAIGRMARETGVFCEPAAAVALAALGAARAEGSVREDELVVLLVTGSGLKDVAAARKAAGEPMRIEPTVAALQRLVASESNRF